MQSASDGGTGRPDGDAAQLVSDPNEDAESIAARRADKLFGSGDVVGGTRWLKIFRRIAMAHRRRAVE